VIVRENADGLVDLAAFARDLGVRNIRFTAFQPYGFTSEAAREDLRPYRDPEFLAALRDQIDRLIAFKRRTGLVGNPEIYLRKVPEFYARGFAIRPFPCVVGYYRIHVGPDGDVRLCGLMPDTRIGNAADLPIGDIWRLPEAQAIRRRLYEGDCLRCWLSCYAEDNMRFFPRTMLAANGGAVRRILGLTRDPFIPRTDWRGRDAPVSVP